MFDNFSQWKLCGIYTDIPCCVNSVFERESNGSSIKTAIHIWCSTKHISLIIFERYLCVITTDNFWCLWNEHARLTILWKLKQCGINSESSNCIQNWNIWMTKKHSIHSYSYFVVRNTSNLISLITCKLDFLYLQSRMN